MKVAIAHKQDATVYLFTTQEEQPILLGKDSIWTLAAITYDILIWNK
jgi:hypothetical protein